MTHNWYPDFKTGVEALSWEGRQRTTDGKEREKSPMEARMRKILACDKVTDCSAAARLQHIWNTSASWKILQEIIKKRWGVGGKGEWWFCGAQWWLTFLLFSSITLFKLCPSAAIAQGFPTFLFLFTPPFAPLPCWIHLSHLAFFSHFCLFPFSLFFHFHMWIWWAFHLPDIACFSV